MSMQPADPFPASDFDQWADSYDSDVVEYSRAFPFDHYEQMLDQVVEWTSPRAGMTILDLGTGTGNLAARFAALGCEVWGSDFSHAMLEKARRKLPQAHLVNHDLRAAWPAELDRRFDRIVSAYALHHFELDRKVSLVSNLVREHLNPQGLVVIADISFPSAAAMQEFAASSGEEWNDEPYWIADEALAALRGSGLKVSYRQIAPCAGVYRIEAA